MARFYFHLRDGDDLLPDHEGIELDIAEVPCRALQEARALLAADIARGLIDLAQWIEVTDAEGGTIHRLLFAEAVAIVGGVDDCNSAATEARDR